MPAKKAKTAKAKNFLVISIDDYDGQNIERFSTQAEAEKFALEGAGEYAGSWEICQVLSRTVPSLVQLKKVG
jgi:hypothetical protein